MLKKKSLTDDEKRYQQQLQQEEDLVRVQQEAAILERARSSQFQGDSKMQKVISIFNREYNNILTDLLVASAPEKRREDINLGHELTRLLRQYNYYHDKVLIHQIHLKEIDQQIKLAEKNVRHLQAQQVTDRQYEDRVWEAMKVLEKLENKLEVQMRKFGAICTENHTLRMEVDHLLNERNVFLKLFDQLIQKVSHGKKYMLDLIEQATIAYDMREEWCSKLQALRMKARAEYMSHIQEMRELCRRQDNNDKLAEFFNIKGQKRIMKDLEKKQRDKRIRQKRQLEEKLANYKNLQAEIIAFTGEQRVNIIAHTFRKQETYNFTNFQYVNHLISEMDAVNDDLGALHLDIDQQYFLQDVREHQQACRLEELHEEIERASDDRCDSEGELQIVNERLGTMMQGISQMFMLCKCNDDPLLRLLGNQSTVNTFNVQWYLEILESTVQELLLKVHYREQNLFERKRDRTVPRIISVDYEKPQIYPIEKIVERNPCPLCVEREMVYDVIDTLQHAYSKEEAKRKLQERLRLPDGLTRLHNVSHCNLPKSREIIQKRFQ